MSDFLGSIDAVPLSWCAARSLAHTVYQVTCTLYSNLNHREPCTESVKEVANPVISHPDDFVVKLGAHFSCTVAT